MIKSYTVKTPKQLRALYALRPEGNQSVENLARAWDAQCMLASVHYSNPMPTGFARIDFDTTARTAMVIRTIYKSEEAVIGRLPYNKALAYCRDNLIKVGEQYEIRNAQGSV